MGSSDQTCHKFYCSMDQRRPRQLDSTYNCTPTTVLSLEKDIHSVSRETECCLATILDLEAFKNVPIGRKLELS